MSKEKSPAFQFYPRDYISDKNVLMMDWVQKGVYFWLIAICWLEETIPADIGCLARITQLSEPWWEENGRLILGCFKPDKNGGLRHPRLDLERRKQRAYRESRQNAGKIGAKNRWSKPASINEENGRAILLPMAKNGSSSSSSISSSISSSEEKKKTATQSSKKRSISSHFCPQDFSITEEMRQWAKLGFPDVDIDFQTAKFKDHEFRNTHSNWNAAWRNWIRNSSSKNNGQKPLYEVKSKGQIAMERNIATFEEHYANK